MAGARGWLLAILSVSILCAVADSLMPEGAVKWVGRLVCGLATLCAVLTPLSGLDLAGGRRWLEDYLAAAELREEELRDQVDQGRKTIIERELAAYIVDKAEEQGMTCTVQVTCRASEEGLFLPDRALVSGPLSGAERDRLSGLIQSELGVPLERQAYDSGEELP